MKFADSVKSLLLVTVLASSYVLGQEGSHTDRVVVLTGLDPVALSQGKHEKGDKRYQLEHDGYGYLFSSRKHLRDFQTDPEKFAVQDDGNCPVAKVMMKRDVKGKPEVFSVHRARTYLFVDDKAKQVFDAEPAKFVEYQQRKPRPREGSGF